MSRNRTFASVMLQSFFILAGFSFIFGNDQAIKKNLKKLLFSDLIGARPSYWCSQANDLVDKKCLDLRVNHLLLGTSVLNCQRQTSKLAPLRWSAEKKLSDNTPKQIRFAIVRSIASYDKTCATLGYERYTQMSGKSELSEIIGSVTKLMEAVHEHDPKESFQYLDKSRKELHEIVSFASKEKRSFNKAQKKTARNLVKILKRDVKSSEKLRRAQNSILEHMSRMTKMIGNLPTHVKRFTLISAEIKEKVSELQDLRANATTLKDIAFPCIALLLVLILVDSPSVHLLCSFSMYIWSKTAPKMDRNDWKRVVSPIASKGVLFILEFRKFFWLFGSSFDLRTTISFGLGAATICVLILQSLKQKIVTISFENAKHRNTFSTNAEEITVNDREPGIEALKYEINVLRTLIHKQMEV